MKKLLFSASLLFCSMIMFSQTLTQTVKGTVNDEYSQEILIGATVELLNSNPPRGTAVDVDGNFILENVPIGRQSFRISILGYEPYFVQELMVTSAKEIVLNILLKPSEVLLDEVVISGKPNISEVYNKMATLSSRQFTVEETQKYAGGMDDPARLVSSFAGVASPSVNNNGISVRGNSPSGLLWRIDGVEVSSPNHFADILLAGSGMFTVLSSQVLGNSDFFTGAFPAEYGNATSGVFDINLRTGNNSKREYTFQAGVLGIDFATEGPFTIGGNSSYLVNYRYSTLGLISNIFPTDEHTKYQDLSFKLNFPTKKAGTFSLWGVGGYDNMKWVPLEKDKWQEISDRESGLITVNMFATGLNHKIQLTSKSFLSSALSFSGSGLDTELKLADDNLVESLSSKAYKNNYKWTLQSSVKTYFSDKHTNVTGFYLNRLDYDFNVLNRTEGTTELTEIANETGASELLQFYTQSKFELSSAFDLSVGVHSQYFMLNKEYTIEPRAALKYKINDKNNLSFAYGLHSRIESLSIYFIKNAAGEETNKNLDLMKSQHFVLSYSTMLTDNISLTIEPYFQFLTNVPVAYDSSYISTLNIQNNMLFNYELVGKGTGKNIGVDFTLERYLKNGLYYMLTASVFDSKYTPLDGIERNTRFNKNYMMNALFGKEWQIGKNKNSFINANIRLNYLGGNRLEAVDEDKTLLYKEIVYGETNGSPLSFANKEKDLPIVSFTVSFRRNRPKFSSVWSLQVLNATSTKDFSTYIFNNTNQTIEKKYNENMVPNLSYKIEF